MKSVVKVSFAMDSLAITFIKIIQLAPHHSNVLADIAEEEYVEHVLKIQIHVNLLLNAVTHLSALRHQNHHLLEKS